MIQFVHVSKQYGDRFHALSDISLVIEKGEFVFLTGASGAGKTTLLKHVYMEEFPTSGQVFSCGFDSRRVQQHRRRDLPALRRKLGIVFQDFRLLGDRSVFENVAFAMRVTGAPERKIKRRVFEVLALTGLSHKCSFLPQQLSGGEQQRVCIARAIVNDPWVLLADEPTGNLDNTIAQEILALLQEINSWGTTVIMATHDIHLVQQCHYRVLELKGGMLKRTSNEAVKPQAALSSRGAAPELFAAGYKGM